MSALIEDRNNQITLPQLDKQKVYGPITYKLVSSSGHYYIGCTTCPVDRFMCHRRTLLKGVHKVGYFNDLFKNGHCFKIEIIRELSEGESIKNAENELLEASKNDKLCLNIQFKSSLAHGDKKYFPKSYPFSSKDLST
jgi:hypothetical protein